MRGFFVHGSFHLLCRGRTVCAVPPRLRVTAQFRRNRLRAQPLEEGLGTRRRVGSPRRRVGFGRRPRRACLVPSAARWATSSAFASKRRLSGVCDHPGWGHACGGPGDPRGRWSTADRSPTRRRASIAGYSREESATLSARLTVVRDRSESMTVQKRRDGSTPCLLATGFASLTLTQKRWLRN